MRCCFSKNKTYFYRLTRIDIQCYWHGPKATDVKNNKYKQCSHKPLETKNGKSSSSSWGNGEKSKWQKRVRFAPGVHAGKQHSCVDTQIVKHVRSVRFKCVGCTCSKDGFLVKYNTPALLADVHPDRVTNKYEIIKCTYLRNHTCK